MNDKRLTKSCKSHNEPQSSHCLVVHEDAHLSYKRNKVKKLCFNGHLKVHIVFVFFRFFRFLYLKNKKYKQTSILKSNKHKTDSKEQMHIRDAR